MDKYEHDRQVARELAFLDSVLGPLASFRKATKRRLDIQMQEVPPDVRKRLIRPHLERSGVSYNVRQVPVFNTFKRRIKGTPDIHEYKKRAGIIWVVCFNMKKLEPKDVHYRLSHFRRGIGDIERGPYTSASFKYVVGYLPPSLGSTKEAELTAGEVSMILDRALDVATRGG